MSKHKMTSSGRWLVTAVLPVLVGVTGVLLFLGARIGIAVYQLYDSATGLYLLTSGPAATKPAVFARELQRADQALDVLQIGSGPLLKVLADLPRVGSAAETAQDLLAVGKQSVTLARTLSTRLQPLWISMQNQNNVPAANWRTALALTAAAGGHFTVLAPDLENLANNAAQAAACDCLPGSIRTTLAQLTQSSRIGAAAAWLGPCLHWLLGMDSPRTLLVLAQNKDELRPTGGFIAAAGTITLDRGEVTIKKLVDSYAIYREDVDHPPAPAALQKYMKAYILLLRDANWSPDAPTSARAAADLYELDTGVQVDGVLLLDTGALAHLVQALGPVTLSERGVTLTGEDLEQQLTKLWNPGISSDDTSSDKVSDAASQTVSDHAVLPAGWWEQRKDFVPQVAQAVLERAQGGGYDTMTFAAAVLAAFDERSLQLWAKDEATSNALNKLGWDGALAPQPNADFLAVVDSNVGFNKVDSVIERSVDYAVNWPDTNGTAQLAAPTAILTLTYTHPLSVTDPGCDQTPRYGNSYADMTKRCYFDYVRVYAPVGSRLISTSGLQYGSVTNETGEKGLRVFSGFFVQPPGTVHTVTFTYVLPAALQPATYALTLQRQAGVKQLPITLRTGAMVTSVQLQSGRFVWLPEPPN